MINYWKNGKTEFYNYLNDKISACLAIKKVEQVEILYLF